MKIGICDDEAPARKLLKNALTEYSIVNKLNFSLIEFPTADDLLQQLQGFDILFLDIDLEESRNGIDLGKHIWNVNKEIKIIYVTSYDSFHIAALSLHAFGYLEKPFKKSDLFSILSDAIQYLRTKIDFSVEHLFEIENVKTKFQIDSIVYFEYIQRNVIIHTTDGKDHVILKAKISDIYEQMKAYGFEVSHKSFIVNLNKVKKIKGYNIYTETTIIPLSQKYSKNFRTAFNLNLSINIIQN
ncbi:MULTISPECIES: LytR/AlgR family response regulator transcription factor [Listeria]|uniref:LytR/AlgR family response regulator transcription factor n=1 Tax=Listeria TaxID=1637 RepID=UPI000E71ECC1|nr:MULTISPECIES: LytTR family DNA-binding domain-containing protein [Listeria]EDH3594664.1 response regulator [Listeria monocytogenes]MBC1910977.1 response regulator transcription factor [Listeria innocua]MBC1926111.1 response regulator transcription factor [Listeria innocua]MBC1929059.1 response regulator transcription factor [Listeria innocua]RJZ11681.1 Transcriptional regulatory protein YpdB [Listeria monocytogenes]